jgi:hypothetical protein
VGPPDLVGTSGLHAYEERARSRRTRLDWTGSTVVSVCREDARDNLKLLARKYERYFFGVRRPQSFRSVRSVFWRVNTRENLNFFDRF